MIRRTSMALLLSSVPSFVSYTLESATDILYNMTLEMGGNCTASAIFVLAASDPPYSVYGTPFGSSADCGALCLLTRMVFSLRSFKITRIARVQGFMNGFGRDKLFHLLSR